MLFKMQSKRKIYKVVAYYGSNDTPPLSLTEKLPYKEAKNVIKVVHKILNQKKKFAILSSEYHPKLRDAIINKVKIYDVVIK